MSGKTKGKKSGTNSGATVESPPFIMHDVRLLFGNLTTPETTVQFNPPSRANPTTIQNNIHPPEATWNWANQSVRENQPVTAIDVGKYGLQADVNTLFRLSSVSPTIVWQPVQNFTIATWTWANLTARNAQPITKNDIGKIGVQTDIDMYYQLTGAVPPIWQPVPNPANSSAPFELSTGASDADSYHDFFRLQIAFEDVWTELLDQKIQQAGEMLYAHWDALMDESADRYDDSGAADLKKRFSVLPVDVNGNTADIAGVDQLTNFLSNLKLVLGLPNVSSAPSNIPVEIGQLKDAVVQTLAGCNMLMTELNRAGSNVQGWTDGVKWMLATAGNNDNQQGDDLTAFPGVPRFQVFTSIINKLISLNPTQPPGAAAVADLTFPDLIKLLTELDAMLKERYRFDVFAPASINYGLMLNYRQHWQPQSYQVGNLVSTIPLAPQETRRYSTKMVVKKTRSTKEISEALRGSKSESADTWRSDKEIVEKAKNQTNFHTNASGSYGNGEIYKVEAGLQQGTDQAIESAQTKREFHESVFKAAQEYRNEHRLEITTEETREDESTSFREIRNPNDELTVTYLFYELQRRYLVDESLYKATPVIMVANEVPAPHEIDQTWILRHDWIIKRTILDDSFLPALEYISTNYTGEELTLQTLEFAVQQQKAVVDKISQQVLLANQSLDATTAGLEDAQNQDINDLKTAETVALVKSFFDPLKIAQTATGGDGNSDRARIDFAKDSLGRAQAKVNQATSDLKSEMTALQMAIDKYTTAATRHYSMLADIDRLRLHIKDNIIYYMQAIWTYEPPDQRYFRLYNLDVPTFSHNTKVDVAPKTGFATVDAARPPISVSFPPPTLDPEPMKLHQVADLDTLIGFKGNYMIFPLVNFDNYMTWYLMQNYIHFDDTAGLIAADPDPGSDLTLSDLKTAMEAIHAKDPQSFLDHQADFEEVMLRLLSNQAPEMMVVPSNSLYIEALPGTHPLLEDFKLIHRAIDIKKAQAEVRKAELENLRLGARLANGELGDPDIDKVVVVGNGHKVNVDAGQ